jgi:hypothetical protein
MQLLFNPGNRIQVDSLSKRRYDTGASGWLDGRGLALRRWIEESPHSSGHCAGEIPGRGNLPDRATETDSRCKAVMVKRWCKRLPAPAAMLVARQPPQGARPNRDKMLPASIESRVGCTDR